MYVSFIVCISFSKSPKNGGFFQENGENKLKIPTTWLQCLDNIRNKTDMTQ